MSKRGNAAEKNRRGRPAREPKGRKFKATFLIVGEGEKTEPNYFRQLKLDERVLENYAVTVKKGPGFSPKVIVEHTIKLVEEARKRGRTFDHVYAVLDVETSEKRESVKEAQKLAGENSINLALSNPSFEVFLYSHFLRTTKAFRDADQVIECLSKEWKRAFNRDYDKADEELYECLLGRLDTAIANCEWARKNHERTRVEDANSSTDVHRLIALLLGRNL
jgi:hypothetical protein